jgi:hypothetical protein
MLQAHQQTIEGRGVNTAFVNTLSGTRAAVFIQQFSDPAMAKAAASLAVALDNFAGSVRVNASQFRDEVIPQNNRAAVINGGLRKAFMVFRDTTVAFQQVTAKATALAMTPVPTTIGNQMIRARAVKQFDAADIAGRATMIQNFTLERLSGLVEAGCLDQLADDLATVARDRFMILAHIARTGLAANFPRVPTPSDPIASGSDSDAAMAAAKASLDELKARAADVDAAAQVLRNVITAVALMCEISTDSAFVLLMNNPAN